MSARLVQSGSVLSLLTALVIALLFAATARDHPDLHTLLDTTLCLVSAMVAALLWISSSWSRSVLARPLASVFAVVSLFYALHAFAAVTWFDHPDLSVFAARLRPATWPPPSYLLPLGILLTLTRSRAWARPVRIVLALLALGVGLVGASFFIPPYTPAGFGGVTRPSLLLIPLLWVAVAFWAWRRRMEESLFQTLVVACVPLVAGNALMLFSEAPHDTLAMAAHVGGSAGLLGLLLHLMQASASDREARLAAELRTSEAQLRSFVEQAPADIAMFDRNMTCLAASERWVKDYGRGHTSLVGLNHYDVHPDVPDRWREIHQKGLSGIAQSADDDSWVQADGSRHWLRWAVKPWRDVHGAIGGIMILAEDITESRRAQEALLDERTLLRTVFDILPDFIYVKDAESRFLAVNEACAVHMGARSPEELLGKTDADFYPPGLAAEFKTDEGSVLAGVPLFNKDEGFVDRDGVHRSVLTTKVPLTDGRGGVRGLVGIGRDITERDQAERRLATQYFVTRVLADAPSLAVAAPGIIQAICETVGAEFGALWEIDRQAQVLRCTNLWHVAGLSAEALEAHTRRIALPAGVGVPGRVWSSGKPLVLRDVAADGNVPRAADAAKAGLRSAFGFPILLRGEVLSVIDFLGREMRPPDLDLLDMLTAIGTQVGQFIEHRQANAHMVQAQKMEAVGQLAGGIAHDFNNILGVILGYADLARRELGADHPLRKRVDAIQKAAERAAALTRQILTFSRKQPVDLRPCDLNRIVADMESMLRRLIGEDVRLVVALDPQLGRVRADPGQLEQVIMNLAVNARDAMPGGGRLVIETSSLDLDASSARTEFELRAGPHVMLSVSDTGQGMNPETITHIFEPFFTTKEQGKGTGLGLAVVYGIVKQSGGSISVWSEPGHGTTFEVYLPQVQEPEKLTPTPSGRGGGGTETVLLVEDEDSLRAVAVEVLQEAGYTVLEAKDPKSALLVAAGPGHRIDLVITDVVLPGGSGPETALQIRAAQPAARVLLVSGYTDRLLDGQRGVQAGTPFLGKPFTIDALLRKVREVLDA